LGSIGKAGYGYFKKPNFELGRISTSQTVYFTYRTEIISEKSQFGGNLTFENFGQVNSYMSHSEYGHRTLRVFLIVGTYGTYRFFEGKYLKATFSVGPCYLNSEERYFLYFYQNFEANMEWINLSNFGMAR
jgi:hypothetical protein